MTHPKTGDEVGDRIIIRVFSDAILFGQRKGELRNCGAYLTDYREWFAYEIKVKEGKDASKIWMEGYDRDFGLL